ncbi:MAG: arylsulfatase [Chthoniobacteraceae bacterium]
MNLRPFLLALVLACTAVAADKPNIIFILADDLGIGDVGAYGGTKIKTPNIDRIAAEGMKFTGFYSGHSVCAPSRCTLMTGQHTGHSAIRNNAQRTTGGEGQAPMPPGTVTVAQLLKKAGYATAIVGKWGLGMPEDKSSPLSFGFDHHYGYLCQGMAHTFYPPYLWRDDAKETLAGNPEYSYGQKGVIETDGKVYSADLIGGDALTWVRKQKEQPFFLYFASTVPHLSLQVPDDSLAQYKGKWPETPFTTSKHYSNHDTPRAAYAAMITRFDRDIGRLLDLLKELNLDEKTLVIFSSDNGAVFPLSGTDPVFFGSTGGLRGYKQDLYEGGIRTPFLARWPGRVKAGSTSAHMGAFWDMMPTFCDIAGVAAPAGTDGISIAPTLLGRPGQKQHEHLYWEYHSGGGAQAVRFAEWKAIRNGAKKAPDSTPELYNLKADPAEKTNVATTNPEIAAKAAALLKSARTPSEQAQWNF